MRQLLIASQNVGKIREYQRLLADLPLTVIGLKDVGLGDMDVDETGTTFTENALLKATEYGQAAGVLTLADDSGLEVDALNGEPGVYSARYGQPGLDDAGRRAYLLGKLADVPNDQRTARFRCVIAIFDPATGQSTTVNGACEGVILHADRDAGQGFGYDAIFQPDGYDQSFAELEMTVKNRISHRGRAVENLPPVLQAFMT